MVSCLYLVFTLHLIFSFVEASFEFYSATEHLKILLETQDKLIGNIDQYLIKEKKRHYVLNKYLKRYKHDYHTTIKDPRRYFGNPINVFTFLKRLTVDVKSFEKTIVSLTSYTKLLSLTSDLPTKADMRGVIKGLLRLQTTYLLNVTDIANGILRGKNNHGEWIMENVTPMSVSDIFDLGHTLFKLKNYKRALPWILEAYHRFRLEEEDTYPFTFQYIVECIGFAHHSIGELESSVNWLKMLVDLDPDNDRAVLLLENQRRQLTYETQTAISGKGEEPEDTKEIADYQRETVIVQRLCRGEEKLPDRLVKLLKCRYMSDINPYFKIGPIKVEQLYRSPDIYRFHEIISDKDIEQIMIISKTHLQREKISDTFDPNATDYKVFKWTELYDHSNSITSKISRLISDITGSDISYSDPLRVANYGVAGYYDLHHDFFMLLFDADEVRLDIKFFDELGLQTRARDNLYVARMMQCNAENMEIRLNRMSTFFFYMSDVELGGATVFTELQLTVHPKRGDALYFDNTKPSGDIDFATLHAACPVLKGHKWVATKWISEFGNEFRRPCYKTHKSIKREKICPRKH